MNLRSLLFRARPIVCLFLIQLFQPVVARAATLPAGFSETLIASGLSNPTAMQFAPDGRLFVCQQGGALRVIKNGVLLATPFLTLSVDSQGERGLLGIAFDPNFATNGFLYVYYTTTENGVHNRISRYTANPNNPDVVLAGSEFRVADLEPLSGATNHNGGALNFGPAGKLYVAVGENANTAHSQTLGNRLGKMLRLDADGTIPTDNPFTGTPGANPSIWALGLRNPFTFAFRPSDGRMHINDVGAGTYEEINLGVAGANYGWPNSEGPTTNPAFRGPIHYYGRSDGCAITGGAFYSPASIRFPSGYFDDYFYADFCGGWIRRLDANGAPIAGNFATGISSPVDLKVSGDGRLYYLARGGGSNTGVVYAIDYGVTTPSISTHPASQAVAPGTPVTFSVVASGGGLRYQWQRGGNNIQGATGSSYTFTPQLSDNGAQFRVIVSNDAGNVTSNAATLTVTTNQPPTATITQPTAGAPYSGGTVISYAGTATDPQDGTLPASAFTWQVDFHHDTHFHPFIPATTGSRSGSFTIPTAGETAANVWYRIYLTVRDAGGMTTTVQRDIQPRRVTVTLTTSPAGLPLRLDGQPVTAPYSFQGVVGIIRTIEAPTPQTVGGNSYQFAGWSDGGASSHTIATPTTNATYTASYQAITGPPPPPTSLTAFTNGLTLSLWWNGSPGATSYVLEGGTAPGLVNVLNSNIGNTTHLQGLVPAGTYYARVRAVGPIGASAASNEVAITLAGTAPCVSPPPAPTGYAAQISGVNVLLSWNPSPSATSYVLEAGGGAGQANILNANVGAVTALAAVAPAGTYFTRVRAANACGASAPSNELPVTLGCSGVPAPPTPLTFTKNGTILTLAWASSPGATTYHAQVGTAPGLSNLIDGSIGANTMQVLNISGVSPGAYFVRIRATSPCGTSAPSNEVIVIVP